MKEFFRYVTLSILGQLGISCYIIADTFFISKGLGADGLTSLNLAIPVFNFLFGCGLMFGVGGATKFSISKSMGHEKEGNTIYSHTVILTVLFSMIFFMTGILGAEKLAYLLGADERTIGMTTTYLRWIMIFAPAFMMNEVLQCFVRNDGAPNLVTIAMLAGSFSNIIMDYILIFPMKLGILGAVLATGFSPLASILIMLPHWLKKKNTFHFIRTGIEAKLSGLIASLGFPSLLAQVSGGIVMIIFNMLILGMKGNVGVAAYGVIANIAIVITALYTGLAQGMQPLLSAYYGRNEKIHIKKVMQYGMFTVVVISLVLYGIVFVFAPQITRVFNSEGNEQLQQIAQTGLQLYFTSNLFLGFNTVIATFFTSVERALPAHVLSLLRGLILIIPLAYMMSAFWGMNGIWLSFPLAEAVVAFLGVCVTMKVGKEIFT